MDRHHNEPPLADRLAMDHADLVKQAEAAAALVPDVVRAIETDEEAAVYTDTAADIKAIIKLADAAFKVEKQPWLDGGKAVDGFFSFRATLTAAAGRCVEAINARQRLILAARRKAEAEAAEKARKMAEAFDEPPPPVAEPVVVKEAARVVSFSGAKASASVKWVHRVTDPDQVPRQYLMVNEAAIKAAVAGGTRSIPGVEIYEDVRTAIRG